MQVIWLNRLIVSAGANVSRQSCEQARNGQSCEHARNGRLAPLPPRLATGLAHSSRQETARWPTAYRPNTRRRGRPADGACRVRRASSSTEHGAAPQGEHGGRKEANAFPQPIGGTAVSHRAPQSARGRRGTHGGQHGTQVTDDQTLAQPCVPALGTLSLPFERRSSIPVEPSSKPDSSLGPKAETPVRRAGWTYGNDDEDPAQGVRDLS